MNIIKPQTSHIQWRDYVACGHFNLSLFKIHDFRFQPAQADNQRAGNTL